MLLMLLLLLFAVLIVFAICDVSFRPLCHHLPFYVYYRID